MGGALVVYYGWWAVKYRASLGWSWLKAKTDVADGRLAALQVQPINEVDEATAEEAKEPVVEEAERLAVNPTAEVMSVGAALFLSEVAGELLKAVRGLAEAAILGYVGKTAGDEVLQEDVLTGVRQLLGRTPYCRLRTTAFQEKVTEDIVGIMKNLGFAGIDAKVVSALWDG